MHPILMFTTQCMECYVYIVDFTQPQTKDLAEYLSRTLLCYNGILFTTPQLYISLCK